VSVYVWRSALYVFRLYHGVVILVSSHSREHAWLMDVWLLRFLHSDAGFLGFL
jgi:hypothetical protein